jgi:hypothetical protein
MNLKRGHLVFPVCLGWNLLSHPLEQTTGARTRRGPMAAGRDPSSRKGQRRLLRCRPNWITRYAISADRALAKADADTTFSVGTHASQAEVKARASSLHP